MLKLIIKMMFVANVIVPVAYASAQEEITGKITNLRTQTTHHTNQNAHGETIFKINGTVPGCSWLSLESGNDTAVSFLLATAAQDKEIKVWYYANRKSEAWGAACQVANIEFNPASS